MPGEEELWLVVTVGFFFKDWAHISFLVFSAHDTYVFLAFVLTFFFFFFLLGDAIRFSLLVS